ncbi:hypothetical protein K439DRAFT_1627025 [Ramaria rubella]|nr:hypothetical protein K439DRAFT_1627025 [Ramaria rubella]
MPADSSGHLCAKRNIEPSIVSISNKRRKLEYPPGLKEVPSIKREPSPSPPPSESLALRTSGTVYVSLPPNCRKSQRGWKARREQWMADESRKLQALRLTITKKIVRDDGLAIDWASSVPVCSRTLKPPSAPPKPSSPSTRIPSLSLPPDSGCDGGNTSEPSQTTQCASMDPLGHALRDQAVFSRLPDPATSTPKIPVRSHTSAPPNPRAHSPTGPENMASGPSDFVVVGAALAKDHPVPRSLEVHEAVPEETVQREHRKLLPQDLRPSYQFQHGNLKESAKDRKLRRLNWIHNEIEKVEGYTGEKVAGFQYDGDDIIIHVVPKKKRNIDLPKFGPPKRSLKTPTLPRQPRAEGRPEPKSLVSPDSKPLPPSSSTSLDTLVGSPVSPRLKDSASVCSSGAAHVAAAVSASYSKAQSPDATSEGNTLTANAANSVLPGAFESLGMIQARGLGFLESYLQLFDSNREALLSAFTYNATFSLSEEEYVETQTGSTSVRHQNIVKTGPSAIVETLVKSIGPDLHHSPLADIAYNIAALDDMSPGGLLLTCEGSLVPVNHAGHPQQPQQFFSRTFVLKQNLEDNRQAWPLKVVAERLAIRRKVK